MTDQPTPKDERLSIEFPGYSGAEANSYAASLANELADIDRSVKLTRTKKDPNTQDAGTILNIALGSAPAALIAGGIAASVRKHRVRIQVNRKNESVNVTGSAAEAAQIIEAIFRKN